MDLSKLDPVRLLHNFKKKWKKKPEPKYVGLKTSTLPKDVHECQMASRFYKDLCKIKSDLDAYRFVLPRETPLETVRLPRGVPYTVTFFGDFGMKCYLFENSKYVSEVRYLREIFIDRESSERKPEIVKVPKTEKEKKSMEDIAKEWWESHQARLVEEIESTGGFVDIVLGKRWQIPDPAILPYVRKYLTELTKDSFYFDSIDDDCNGLVVSNLHEWTFPEPEKEKVTVAESRAEKFAKRQAKATA